MTGSSSCSSLPKLTFGTFTPEKLVSNGEQVSGQTASVVCSVRTATTGTADFSVSGLASTAGGISVNVTGNLNASAPAGTLTGTFIWSDGQTFTRDNCTVTYGVGAGVAPGRIWAQLDCPAKGATIPDSCIAVAQIKFENCAQ